MVGAGAVANFALFGMPSIAKSGGALVLGLGQAMLLATAVAAAGALLAEPGMEPTGGAGIEGAAEAGAADAMAGATIGLATAAVLG